MHKSTITVTLVAALTTVTALGSLDTPPANADDFSALLADLSFGNEPALDEEPAVIAQAPQAVLETPVMLNEAPQSLDPEAESVPQTFDFEAAFAAQQPKSSTPAQTVGHLHRHRGEGGCSSPGGCCDSAGCGDHADVCTPHTPVNLPTSSFYQYFRSNKCNTHVWDGYRQRCRSANAHLHGSCDCFDEKKGCGLGDCGEIVECTDCPPAHRRPLLRGKRKCDDCDVTVGSCDG